MGLEGSRFLVEELAVPGAPVSGDPARFEWTSEKHSIPFKPWEYELRQRTVRTDYPGADSPSEQILGPNYEPFDMAGEWLDKWNEAGFAHKTRRDFESMVRRGSMVRFTWRDIVFTGIITRFRPAVRNAFEVSYSFTVSPHFRADREDPILAPRTVKDPRQHARDLAAASEDFPGDPPLSFIGNPVERAVLAIREKLDGVIGGITSSVDQAVLSPVGDSISALKALVSSFAVARGELQQIVDELYGLESDALGFTSALDLMSWEVWKRGTVRQAHVMISLAFDAERDVVSQAQPDVIAIYRALPNESLYAVSLKFYGTPTNWNLIAQRNGLSGILLDGGELLLIPQVAGR